jgi:hypothetical protein
MHCSMHANLELMEQKVGRILVDAVRLGCLQSGTVKFAGDYAGTQPLTGAVIPQTPIEPSHAYCGTRRSRIAGNRGHLSCIDRPV